MSDNENVEQDNLKELRKLAEQGKKALEEKQQLERELAFARAGIDTGTKLGAMFYKTYEGELSRDAILAEAQEIPGLIAPVAPTTPAPDVKTEPTSDQTDVRLGLSASSDPAAALGEDPNILAYKAFEEQRRQGVVAQQAFGAAWAEIVKAAENGDPRVVIS